MDFVTSKIDTTALLDGSVKSFLESYKTWIKKIYSFFNDIITKNTINKDLVKVFLLEITTNVNKNINNALMLFGKKFENILYVYPQTLETIISSYIIGNSLNLTQLEIFNLLVAALFHDIGMLKVPRVILDKKDSLTSQEISIIKEHTIQGFKLLREVKYSPIIASGALQHHERIDGMGYPNGITGEKITGIAKIISIVDAYSAAIANKPYKETNLHGKEVIQDLLRGGGSAYDPSILKELIKNISFYPIGSLVILSNTKIARVVGTSGVPMKPIVKIVEAENEGEVLDLSKKDDLYIKEPYIKKKDEE
jgi:HD-GYP domain-containing protein (c-di-GMP phosphodiesterase class II)